MGRFRRFDRQLVAMYPYTGGLGRTCLCLMGHPFEKPCVRVVSNGDFE